MQKQELPVNPILLVDDEEDVLRSYRMALKYDGLHNLILCSDSTKVKSLLLENTISVIILDLFMPDVTGKELLGVIQKDFPEIPVIVSTGANNIETAVECMRLGAFDYMVKPVENSRLVSSIRKALEIHQYKEEVKALKRQVLEGDLKNPDIFSEIITVSEKMKNIFKYIEAIAKSPKPVLITGESGVGKELFARAIHCISELKGEMVTVNVAGLDDTVFSDTLFGHKKGAFTGADSLRGGLIEQAKGGTLFLDEIGDLSNSSQVKLLRLIQNGEYYPLGSDTVKKIDARIITATNVDIGNKFEEGAFRKDLYYRLITHHINIVPLRERHCDLPYLIDHFIDQAATSLGKGKPEAPDGLSVLLESYSFPGNVRELEAIIFNAVSRMEGKTLNLSLFKDYLSKNDASEVDINKDKRNERKKISYEGQFPKLKDVEDFFINEAMKKAKGNQSIAAGLLGISQSTLSRRYKDKYG